MKRLFNLLVTLSLFVIGFTVSAQNKAAFQVSGNVSDTYGDPVPGVSIICEANRQGVITDIDGNYTISAASDDATLIYSFMGMKTQEIKISQRKVINVVMEEDAEALDDAIIIGAYGTKQRREDLVGSAFQVNSEVLKDRPTARLDNILDGLIPGMSVEVNSDAAGTTRARVDVRVRGEASLNASNSPLWVIDGVPAYTGGTTGLMPGVSSSVSPISLLDPNDIESITVLKDADQTTIYGANGANGVILVTTKQGATGNQSTKISTNVTYGVSMPDKSTMFKMMNASQYMEVAKEAWVNSGYLIKDFPYHDNDYNSYSTTSTNWPDQYLGLGSTMYASVSASSGTSKQRSYVSGSYYQNNNIVQKDKSERFYLRINNNYQINKKMDLGVSLTATMNNEKLFKLSTSYLETLPIFSPYLDNGEYRLYNKVWDNVGGSYVMRKFFDNEIPDREENENLQRSVKTVANFNFSWKILEELTLSSVFGVDYQHAHEDMYYSRLTLGGLDSNNNVTGSSSKNDASYFNWTNTNRLSYAKKFGKHSVSSYAGLELRETTTKSLGGSARGFINDYIRELSYADDATESASSSRSQTRAMSYFVRGEYSFDSRYYLSFNWRRDGNSSFGAYSRWANFASVGTSWNIHKEKFFNSDKIKMLKLKASYGTSGNSRVDSSAGKGTYSYSSSYSYMGVTGAKLGTVPNENLSWETTKMLNLGVRIELDNILDAELEYYNNKTSDLLTKVYVSRVVSDDRIYANVGSMRNTGVELNLTTYNFNKGDFRWTTTMNVSHNDNKILKLYQGISTGFITSVWTEGHDSNAWYLVRWAGVDPSDGMPMWYDKDGNITKTFDYDNRVADKSKTPICFGGIINTFSYRNLSLSMQINYTIGGHTLPSYASLYFDDGYDIIGGNQAIEVYHYRWKQPGDYTSFPKVSQVSTRSGMSSTRFLYNRTNFKLSHVTLSYRMPGKIARSLRMDDLTFTLMCENAYLFTPDQSRHFNSYKTAMNGYPVTRTISFGVNASF